MPQIKQIGQYLDHTKTWAIFALLKKLNLGVLYEHLTLKAKLGQP